MNRHSIRSLPPRTVATLRLVRDDATPQALLEFAAQAAEQAARLVRLGQLGPAADAIDVAITMIEHVAEPQS